MASEVCGFIFMCSDDTFRECVGRQLFGMPKSHSKAVELIKQGTILFLYNFQSKQLYGVFQAKGNGGFMLNKEAWVNVAGNSKRESPYPAQVAVSRAVECDPLNESEFMPLLMKNRRKKFRHRLSRAQLHELLGLFNSQIHGKGGYSDILSKLMEQTLNNRGQQQQGNNQVAASNRQHKSGFDLSQLQDQVGRIQRNQSEGNQFQKVLQQKVDTLYQRVDMLQNVNVDIQKVNVDLQRRVKSLEQTVEEFKSILGKRNANDDDVYPQNQNANATQYDNNFQEYQGVFSPDGPGFKVWPDEAHDQYNSMSSKRVKMGGKNEGFNVCQAEKEQQVKDQELVQCQYYSFTNPALEECMNNMKLSCDDTP